MFSCQDLQALRGGLLDWDISKSLHVVLHCYGSGYAEIHVNNNGRLGDFS